MQKKGRLNFLSPRLRLKRELGTGLFFEQSAADSRRYPHGTVRERSALGSGKRYEPV